LAALAAVVMWASLATLAATLSHIPPLLLTSLGLLIGSAISLPLSGFKLNKTRMSKSEGDELAE